MPTDHEPLDRFRLLIAKSVLKRHTLAQIRSHSIRALARWRSAGAWCAGYERWEQVLKEKDDGPLLAAMTRLDQASVELRRSMPWAGLLPWKLVDALGRRAGVGAQVQVAQGPERYSVTVVPGGPNADSVSIAVVDELTGRRLGASGSHAGAPQLVAVLIEDHRERREADAPAPEC